MHYANDNTPIATASGITFISMFSGIEAASVAFGPLGWRAIAFAEIEKFPSAVLAHHYPDVPNVGDMTAHDWSQYRGKVDIVCGGPPCQAFSVAGLRNSMDDARGNLSISYMRALHAIKPRNAIVENVPGWLSTKDNAFGCFLAGLVGADDPLPPPAGRSWPDAGMVAGPKGRAAWCVLDAQHFGLAQRRRRVIVVADFGNGADPSAVLLERKSLSGYSPTSRKAGQGVAGATADCFSASSIGTYRSADVSGADRAAGGDNGGGSENLVAFAPDIARCVATREGSSQDYETTTMVAVSVTGTISHALTAEGHDASEDGSGRGAPIVAFSAKDYGADASVDLAPTLRAGGHTGSHANAGVMPAIAFNSRQDPIHADECAQRLGAKDNGNGLLVHSAVRRLTPTECERLQGFPDGYTDIPWRGKANSPDGPRYKALGNSWAVPKFRWVGERIARLMPAPHPAANDNTPRQEAA